MSDVADSAGKDTNTNSGDACSSIALAAQKYESEHSSSKKNLAEIQVMTGEEDERSVVQVWVILCSSFNVNIDQRYLGDIIIYFPGELSSVCVLQRKTLLVG